nr:MAG TPA: hypothetical protein [Caudoviricetes sp.]
MLGKTNSGSGGGGGSSVAEYVYENTTEEVNFPRQALTEGANNFFYGTSTAQLDAMKEYLNKGNEVAYWGAYSSSWKVLQNSESWSGTPMYNTNIAFAFSEPVTPKFFHSRIGSTEWNLMATNDWDIFTTYLGNGASSEFMTTLIASGEDTNVTGGVDTAIGDGTASYKYYVFKDMYSYSYIYNIALKVNTGNVTCTLNSTNMTPSFKCYPDNYMRVITQDWHNGSEIVPSKKLIYKPYEDGGCLVNYTDDGKAVNLKMFLMTGTDTSIYILSPDDNFTLEGYSEKKQVADLNIPAHLYKSVVFETFEQPVLTANGTIGGSDFAVVADSEIDGSRPAWKAFDGNTVLSDASTDQWHSQSGQPHWLEWYSPNILSVNKIIVFNGADNVLPLDWEVQYSDNNEEWTTGASGTNTALTANAEWEINSITGGYHKYWRFRTTSGSGTDSEYLGITELQISGVVQKEAWVMGSGTIPPVAPDVEQGVGTE